MQSPANPNVPSAHEWAHLLGGKVMPNGRTVRFPRPGRKHTDRSLTLTVGPHWPDGWSFADPEKKIPWQEGKAWLRKVAGLPDFPASKNSGPRHRPADGPIVQEAEPAGFAPGEAEAAASPPTLFDVLDADEALKAKAPDLLWHVDEWLPGNNVSLLTGHGGEGKSLLALQLAHLTRCGMPFFGRSVRAGAAVFYSAEETRDELAYRLQRIFRSMPAPEIMDVLKLVSMADRSALLGTPKRHSVEMDPTPMLAALEELVHDIEAVLLVIDASADVYGGNEIDRSQVRSFISLLRGIAIRQQCAVLLLGHPSVRGMADSSGTSGSTAWHNSVRARCVLTTPNENSDPFLRQLEFKKIQNAPRGGKVLMRFEEGFFQHQVGTTQAGMSTEQQAKALTVFLELVQKANDRGQRLSDKPSVSYAPTMLKQEAEARGITKDQLKWALHAGLGRNLLAMQEERRNGRPSSRLVVVQPSGGQQ